ncbi:hypothetical protein KSP40_PGU008201 [Platanthera guangdongensis]|uniref:Uncharacterized protein n=1 Tax=Platanthera guangdongensis TaxID=2320717 RepID=A0ABR2MET8_9ASPA
MGVNSPRWSQGSYCGLPGPPRVPCGPLLGGGRSACPAPGLHARMRQLRAGPGRWLAEGVGAPWAATAGPFGRCRPARVAADPRGGRSGARWLRADRIGPDSAGTEVSRPRRSSVDILWRLGFRIAALNRLALQRLHQQRLDLLHTSIHAFLHATLHKEVLYMAGQLGLDPPTMLLRPGGPTAEMDQALLNCEAVANCFKCSIATSSISITVYCSAFISSFEMAEIQNRMDADTIDSEADHDLISLHSDYSNRRVKAMASFFSRFIDKIISYNDFSWQDLKGLRFYFLKELGTLSGLLYPVFADAFSEFTAGDGPLFSFVPVLGSGGSASMDDLMTCDLFASKH